MAESFPVSTLGSELSVSSGPLYSTLYTFISEECSAAAVSESAIFPLMSASSLSVLAHLTGVPSPALLYTSCLPSRSPAERHRDTHTPSRFPLLPSIMPPTTRLLPEVPFPTIACYPPGKSPPSPHHGICSYWENHKTQPDRSSPQKQWQLPSFIH